MNSNRVCFICVQQAFTSIFYLGLIFSSTCLLGLLSDYKSWSGGTSSILGLIFCKNIAVWLCGLNCVDWNTEFSTYVILTLCVSLSCDRPSADVDCLHLLRHVIERGNTTVFEWQTGRPPLKVIETPFVLDALDEDESQAKEEQVNDRFSLEKFLIANQEQFLLFLCSFVWIALMDLYAFFEVIGMFWEIYYRIVHGNCYIRFWLKANEIKIIYFKLSACSCPDSWIDGVNSCYEIIFIMDFNKMFSSSC